RPAGGKWAITVGARCAVNFRVVEAGVSPASQILAADTAATTRTHLADENFRACCLIWEMRTPLLFFVGLFFIMFRPTVDAEKPFQFATTPGKLPKEVLPVEYSVRIVPNIDKFTFTGTERVKLSVRSPVRQLVLNSLELKITHASLDGKVLPKSAIKTDKKNELLILAFN